MDLEKLKTFIRVKGISVEALADKIGLSKQSMYYKLAGDRDFRATELNKIAHALDMTTDDIMSIFFTGQVDISVH